jgi:hypothetical protein
MLNDNIATVGKNQYIASEDYDVGGNNWFNGGSEPIPGGTTMPGQLVIEPEQVPELHPLAKISLISKRAHDSAGYESESD